MSVNVVFFLVDDSPVSVPFAKLFILLVHKTYEDDAVCSETSAHKTQKPGEPPKKKEYNTHNTAEVRN